MGRSNTPDNLAGHRRAVIVAPAGCGKTELIVRSVGRSSGRQLILTHTHAGVDSLTSRFRKYNIASSSFQVETIHSFALRYASSYPKTSEITTAKPTTNEDYRNVIESACSFLESTLAKEILKNSYDGIYVDEYQDCTVEQHKLIMQLANVLPCRILGDPLQGIFDFGTNQIVDWERDIYPNFERLKDLDEPWRWKHKNSRLGDWLLQEVRYRLSQNMPIDISRDLESIECFCEGLSEKRTIAVLYKALENDSSTYVMTVPEIASKTHNLASKMRNLYRTIEPVTSDEICKIAVSIDTASGIKRLENVFDFADSCLTAIRRDCGEISNAIRSARNQFQSAKKIRMLELSKEVISSGSCHPVLELLLYLESAYEVTIKRHQLWTEMKKAMSEVIKGNHRNIVDAVWEIRNRGRFVGRRIPARCISRTLLLKGLECDNAIIVDAGSFNQKNLYVAMTRPSRRLHILLNSPSSNFNVSLPKCPKCNSILVRLESEKGPFLGCPRFPKCKFAQSLSTS